jgi:hypothetical protein
LRSQDTSRSRSKAKKSTRIFIDDEINSLEKKLEPLKLSNYQATRNLQDIVESEVSELNFAEFIDIMPPCQMAEYIKRMDNSTKTQELKFIELSLVELETK